MECRQRQVLASPLRRPADCLISDSVFEGEKAYRPGSGWKAACFEQVRILRPLRMAGAAETFSLPKMEDTAHLREMHGDCGRGIPRKRGVPNKLEKAKQF